MQAAPGLLLAPQMICRAQASVRWQGRRQGRRQVVAALVPSTSLRRSCGMWMDV